jgi:photosystem II stability/assembly factor-like uncharacterized protein
MQRRAWVLACALTCAAGVAAAMNPAPSLDSRLLLLDAARVGNRLLAVGERGYVLSSDDRGRTWQAQHIAADATLTALTQVGSVLWAVGHDAIILKSSDAGRHWRRVHDDPARQAPLLDVLFIDALHGFAVGAYGTFLQSNDGGEHWFARGISANDFHLNAMTRLGDGTLLIVGEHGTLLRSVDDGVSWQALVSPYVGSWFGVLPVGVHAALVFGLRGQLWRSDDAGAHWTALPVATQASLQGGRVLDDGTVVVVGYDGVVLTSTDQARHFTLHRQPGNAAYATALGTRRTLLLFGERGVTRSIVSP